MRLRTPLLPAAFHRLADSRCLAQSDSFTEYCLGNLPKLRMTDGGTDMTRWIMIAMTLIGLAVAILTHSPGVLGFALLLTVVGLFGTVFSLAADRISANSRPDAAMLPPEVLHAIRDKANAARGGGPARSPSSAKTAAAGDSVS